MRRAGRRGCSSPFLGLWLASEGFAAVGACCAREWGVSGWAGKAFVVFMSERDASRRSLPRVGESGILAYAARLSVCGASAGVQWDPLMNNSRIRLASKHVPFPRLPINPSEGF